VDICRLIYPYIDFSQSEARLAFERVRGLAYGSDSCTSGHQTHLLRSKKWEASDIADGLLEKSKTRYEQIRQASKLPLLIWDESSIEKPESIAVEGLCSVASSKGKRLTRINPGFYKPPTDQICVPGFHWTAAILTTPGEVPSVCQMEWWTSRGENKEEADQVFDRLFDRICTHIPGTFVHVMDRGYAKAEMVNKLKQAKQDFIIRWVKNRYLIHEQKGFSPLLQSNGHAQNFRCTKKKYRDVSIAFIPVRLP